MIKMTPKYTHCRECDKELTDEDNLAPDLCNACEEALAEEFAKQDILMPRGDEWKKLLEAARETRSQEALAAIGSYILWFLADGE